MPHAAYKNRVFKNARQNTRKKLTLKKRALAVGFYGSREDGASVMLRSPCRVFQKHHHARNNCANDGFTSKAGESEKGARPIVGGMVFALFFKHPDGHLKFIADAANSTLAIYLGKRCSLEKQMPVVGFENGRDGTTRECCRFEKGELVGVFTTMGQDRAARPGSTSRMS